MNILFRIALAVYAFCLTIVSMVSILFTLNPTILENVADFVSHNTSQNRTLLIVLVIIELIFLALSITFLSSGIKSNKGKRAISKYTEIGEIKVSLESIEGIALSSVKKMSGIKDVKAYVKSDSSDGVSITIKISVSSDCIIPTVSENVQNKVKKSVEENSGIKVSHIKVLIESVYNVYRSKVE